MLMLRDTKIEFIYAKSIRNGMRMGTENHTLCKSAIPPQGISVVLQCRKI